MNFLFLFFSKNNKCIHWSHKFCIWKTKHPISPPKTKPITLFLSHVGFWALQIFFIRLFSLHVATPAAITTTKIHGRRTNSKSTKPMDPTQKWVKKLRKSRKKRVAVGVCGRRKKEEDHPCLCLVLLLFTMFRPSKTYIEKCINGQVLETSDKQTMWFIALNTQKFR